MAAPDPRAVILMRTQGMVPGPTPKKMAKIKKNSPSRMPRADVAKFMLDCLSKSELFKKSVAVGL